MGEQTYAGQVELVADPALSHSAADAAAQRELVMKLYRMQGDLAFLDDVVKGARDAARQRAARLVSPDRNEPGSPMGGRERDRKGRGGERVDPLARSLESFADRLDALHRTLVATKEGLLTGEEQLRERVVDVYGAVSGFGGRPTRSQIDRTRVLEGEMEAKRKEFDAIVRADLERLNAALVKKGFEPITLMTREEFDKKESSG